MSLYPYPPRLLMLSLSDAMYKLVGKTASFAGLQLVYASRLKDVRFFARQRGIVVVILEVNNCCDTFRMVADVQERLSNAPLIIITEDDQSAQDRLALRLGANYVFKKPCDPVELDRVFRFVLENHAVEAECWESMKRDLAKRLRARTSLCPSAPSQQLEASSFLTMAEIEKRAILAAVKLADGDVLRAAKLLAISKTTMYRKLHSYKRNVGEMTTEQPVARLGP